MNFKTDKIILAIFLIISAGLGFLPYFVKSEYLLRLIAVVILWIGLAGCWNMMSGYTGYIDFGPVVYFGIGSYVVAIAMTKYGMPFFPGLILAGYVDAVVARGEIAGDFAALSTSEPGGAGKSERVGELVRRFSRHRSILVGDRYLDLEAARANACMMVGATYGYARQGELDSADALISAFPELLEVVERWSGGRPSSR